MNNSGGIQLCEIKLVCKSKTGMWNLDCDQNQHCPSGWNYLQCNGAEARLQDCPSNGPGIYTCVYYEDAGVEYQGKHQMCVGCIH